MVKLDPIGGPQLGRPSPTRTRAAPVKVWAVVGALWLALLVYMWSSWLLDGDAKPPPKGPTVVPQWQQIAAVAWQLVMVVGTILVFWFFLIRPWIRTGRARQVISDQWNVRPRNRFRMPGPASAHAGGT